jgi:hypothetical protein
MQSIKAILLWVLKHTHKAEILMKLGQRTFFEGCSHFEGEAHPIKKSVLQIYQN